MSLYLIAALGQQGQLGLEGKLPWGLLQGDMAWFKALTTAEHPDEVARAWILAAKHGRYALSPEPPYEATHANAVIMGRRTWESLPEPLQGRKNIVLRHYPYHPPMAGPDLQRCSLACAIHEAIETFESPHTFIIGGVQGYAEALRLPQLEALFLTEVEYSGEADTWWPPATHLSWIGGTIAVGGLGGIIYWRRTRVSPWIEEPERPRFRFGIWVKG